MKNFFPGELVILKDDETMEYLPEPDYKHLYFELKACLYALSSIITDNVFLERAMRIIKYQEKMSETFIIKKKA